MDEAGYDARAPFAPAQFSEGQGVFAVWMVVPRGHRTTGSSPDFEEGPIIPNSLFPIHVDGSTSRNGESFNPGLAVFDIPALNDPALTPSFDVDGHSHFPVFIADNADFGPPGADLKGRYKYELTMLDQSGAGWSISISFTIKRER